MSLNESRFIRENTNDNYVGLFKIRTNRKALAAMSQKYITRTLEANSKFGKTDIKITSRRENLCFAKGDKESKIELEL